MASHCLIPVDSFPQVSTRTWYMGRDRWTQSNIPQHATITFASRNTTDKVGDRGRRRRAFRDQKRATVRGQKIKKKKKEKGLSTESIIARWPDNVGGVEVDGGVNAEV